MVSRSPIPDDPETDEAAMKSPKAEKWKATMLAEYQSLMQNETWKLVSMPKDRHAIACK
jgi:hypothetical protein